MSGPTRRPTTRGQRSFHVRFAAARQRASVRARRKRWRAIAAGGRRNRADHRGAAQRAAISIGLVCLHVHAERGRVRVRPAVMRRAHGVCDRDVCVSARPACVLLRLQLRLQLRPRLKLRLRRPCWLVVAMVEVGVVLQLHLRRLHVCTGAHIVHSLHLRHLLILLLLLVLQRLRLRVRAAELRAVRAARERRAARAATRERAAVELAAERTATTSAVRTHPPPECKVRFEAAAQAAHRAPAATIMACAVACAHPARTAVRACARQVRRARDRRAEMSGKVRRREARVTPRLPMRLPRLADVKGRINGAGSKSANVRAACKHARRRAVGVRWRARGRRGRAAAGQRARAAGASGADRGGADVRPWVQVLLRAAAAQRVARTCARRRKGRR